MTTHHTSHTGIRRFRAKVANHGFRGAYWQKGDIVEVTPEEAEVIPHHWEELGKADDGSDDKDLHEKLVEQEKIDNLKDKKAKQTYDRVQPEIQGGPAVIVEKTPEQKAQEAKDRKAEEVENEKRREDDRSPRAGKRSAASATESDSEKDKHNKK